MKRVQPSMAEPAEKIASQFVLARAGRGPQPLANMQESILAKQEKQVIYKYAWIYLIV